MADIINLNRARKAKAKAEKSKAAEANRIAHGTPKALKTLERARKDQTSERFKGHELEKPGDDN